jgi:hypothetical protein
MTKPIGIWLDHRQAVIAELAPEGSRFSVVETTDKLTDRQVVASVRKHFGRYGWPVAVRDSTMQQRPENRRS